MNKIVIPYKPRKLQQEVHENLKRFNGFDFIKIMFTDITE